MKQLILSCFGLGRLPLAPGTWGSIPSAALFFVVMRLSESGLVTGIVLAVVACAASVCCVRFAPEMIKATGKTDPGQVVVDEVAGQAITYLPSIFLLSAAGTRLEILIAAAAGFLLFRIFDTLKPWPAYDFEKLPAGWGILADDLMAGVYAGIAMIVFVRLWLESIVSFFGD